MVFCLTIKMPCDQLMKCFLLRLISINLFITIACLQQKVEAKPEVPCFFIFGDSLSDSGNNNILNTTAKVNFPPYGVDFPSGRPTGRFSNGRTSVDVIGQLLGFEEFIPPFPEATSSNIETGVNYASGGCGIRDETGRNLGGCFPMSESKLALVKTSGFASVLSLRDDGLCIPNQAPCEDRLLQVYWDSFHPTETVNEILGILAYSHQNLSIIYPLNIKSLVQL